MRIDKNYIKNLSDEELIAEWNERGYAEYFVESKRQSGYGWASYDALCNYSNYEEEMDRRYLDKKGDYEAEEDEEYTIYMDSEGNYTLDDRGIEVGKINVDDTFEAILNDSTEMYLVNSLENNTQDFEGYMEQFVKDDYEDYHSDETYYFHHYDFKVLKYEDGTPYLDVKDSDYKYEATIDDETREVTITKVEN